jgi:hypothetical protein
MRKLGLKGRTELIKFALSRGIVPLDPPLPASEEGRDEPSAAAPSGPAEKGARPARRRP